LEYDKENADKEEQYNGNEEVYVEEVYVEEVYVPHFDGRDPSGR
jgi:hypothetical protein